MQNKAAYNFLTSISLSGASNRQTQHGEDKKHSTKLLPKFSVLGTNVASYPEGTNGTLKVDVRHRSGSAGVQNIVQNQSALAQSIQRQSTAGEYRGTNKIDKDLESENLEVPNRYNKKRPSSASYSTKKIKSRATSRNTAALDFLKGISLGDSNKPHKKLVAKLSQNAEVVPVVQGKDPQFVASTAHKLTKIPNKSTTPATGRIFITTSSHCTVAVFSVIKFDVKSNKKEREKKQDPLCILKDSLTSSTTLSKTVTKSNSFAQLLYSGWVVPRPEDLPEDFVKYDPHVLDNPSLTTGKHRTVMNLPSFKESIIPFVKPGVIKEELNELFKQAHPWVQPGVTLHKIRKIKKALVTIALLERLEMSTVALAYVYFEKLIIKNIVVKAVIRTYGAVCLLLAAKLHDPRHKELKSLIEAIEKGFGSSAKELLQYEFPVFAALSFGLFCDPEEVLIHLNRINKDVQDMS